MRLDSVLPEVWILIRPQLLLYQPVVPSRLVLLEKPDILDCVALYASSRAPLWDAARSSVVHEGTMFFMRLRVLLPAAELVGLTRVFFASRLQGAPWYRVWCGFGKLAIGLIVTASLFNL